MPLRKRGSRCRSGKSSGVALAPHEVVRGREPPEVAHAGQGRHRSRWATHSLTARRNRSGWCSRGEGAGAASPQTVQRKTGGAQSSTRRSASSARTSSLIALISLCSVRSRRHYYYTPSQKPREAHLPGKNACPGVAARPVLDALRVLAGLGLAVLDLIEIAQKILRKPRMLEPHVTHVPAGVATKDGMRRNATGRSIPRIAGQV